MKQAVTISPFRAFRKLSVTALKSSNVTREKRSSVPLSATELSQATTASGTFRSRR